MSDPPEYEKQLKRIAYLLNHILATVRFIAILAFVLLLAMCGR